MGLLDDAIREHLELKRRRGADPAEVERAEREALGPVRRGPEEPAIGLADHGVAGDGVVYEPATAWEDEGQGHPAPDGLDFDEYELEDGEYEEAPATPTSALDHDPRDHDPEPRGTVDRGEAPPVQFAAEAPTDEQLAPRAPAEPPLEDEHADLVPGEGEPDADGSEDVLEETPEFLQDTPDHDRLWFEQRPPRDFDFDG